MGREVILVVREMLLVVREMVLRNGSGGWGNCFRGAGNSFYGSGNGSGGAGNGSGGSGNGSGGLGNCSGGAGNGSGGARNESLITDDGTASLYCHPARRTQQLFSQLLYGRKINISHLFGRPLIRKTGINDGLIDIVKSGKERLEVYGRKTRRLQ